MQRAEMDPASDPSVTYVSGTDNEKIGRGREDLNLRPLVPDPGCELDLLTADL